MRSAVKTDRKKDVRSSIHPDISDLLKLLGEHKISLIDFVIQKKKRYEQWKLDRFRICQICYKKKYRFEFVGDSKYCNDCKRQYKIKKTLMNREKKREYMNSGVGLQQHCAKQIVWNLIKMGLLARGVCEVCGGDKNVQAHHADYHFPDKVQWLCRDHHYEWHRHNNPIYI
jgi:hypothetical protein